MTERIANQTSSMAQRLAEMIFRAFQQESLNMIKISKEATAEIIKNAKSNRFKEYSVEKLMDISGTYGISEVSVDKDYYHELIKYMQKHNIAYAKDLDGDKYIVYFSNSNKEIMKNFSAYLENKRNLSLSEIKTYTLLTKTKEIMTIQDLSKYELDLIEELKSSRNLKFSRLDNSIVIAKDDYDTFINEYREIRCVLNSSKARELIESLNLKKLSNEVVKLKEKSEIEKYKDYILIDAASPDKRIDIYSDKQAKLLGKDRLSEEDITNINNKFVYFVAPVLVKRSELKNFENLDIDEKKIYMDKLVKYKYIEEYIQSLTEKEKSEIDINLRTKTDKVNKNKTFTKSDFEKILKSKDYTQSTERLKDRERGISDEKNRRASSQKR